MSDASDPDTNNTTLPYQSLVAFQDISIRIAYSTANSEALSTTCVITPVATNPNGLTSVLSVNSPVSSFNFTSMMYYISKNAIDTSVNGNEFFENGIPATTRTNNLYYNRIALELTEEVLWCLRLIYTCLGMVLTHKIVLRFL